MPSLPREDRLSVLSVWSGTRDRHENEPERFRDKGFDLFITIYDESQRRKLTRSYGKRYDINQVPREEQEHLPYEMTPTRNAKLS